jgi:hypothetical protein
VLWHLKPSRTLRVIFDRSAFHGDNFAALENSRLRKAVAADLVTVFHTPVFLDETIMAYGAREASDEWKAHLAFAVDVCNGGIFLAKEEIWRNELVRGEGQNGRHLLPMTPNKNSDSLPRVLQTLRDVANSGDLRNAWLASRAEREETQAKKTNQKGIFRDVREEIAQAKRDGRLRGNQKEYPFAAFLKSELLRTGRLFMGVVDEKRAGALACQWAQNPERYPYYTAFIEGALYSGYFAMIEQNLALDRNAQADYEQLAYLLWADVVVSNDEKFFRSAFQTIWAPRGKRMESAESFAALLRAIYGGGT